MSGNRPRRSNTSYAENSVEKAIRQRASRERYSPEAEKRTPQRGEKVDAADVAGYSGNMDAPARRAASTGHMKVDTARPPSMRRPTSGNASSTKTEELPEEVREIREVFDRLIAEQMALGIQDFELPEEFRTAAPSPSCALLQPAFTPEELKELHSGSSSVQKSASKAQVSQAVETKKMQVEELDGEKDVKIVVGEIEDDQLNNASEKNVDVEKDVKEKNDPEKDSVHQLESATQKGDDKCEKEDEEATADKVSVGSNTPREIVDNENSTPPKEEFEAADKAETPKVAVPPPKTASARMRSSRRKPKAAVKRAASVLDDEESEDELPAQFVRLADAGMPPFNPGRPMHGSGRINSYNRLRENFLNDFYRHAPKVKKTVDDEDEDDEDDDDEDEEVPVPRRR